MMSRLRLALFQPDIALNVGACARLCACWDVTLDVIEPCGFPFSLKALRRSAMDYADMARIEHWPDWRAFEAAMRGDGRRLVLLTTRAQVTHTGYGWRADDVLLMGRESAGAPDFIHARADGRLRIPMRPEARSLNIGMAAALALGAAMARTGGFEAL